MKVLFLLVLLLLASCNRNTSDYIDISKTDNIAMSSQWAVITEPYVSYVSEADASSQIIAYGRIGDVIEVAGSSIGDNNVHWYTFENGWLPENSIRIYANKLQADFAAKELN